eukprot:2232953-Pyramimonas_sp.AAC.1
MAVSVCMPEPVRASSPTHAARGNDEAKCRRADVQGCAEEATKVAGPTNHCGVALIQRGG